MEAQWTNKCCALGISDNLSHIALHLYTSINTIASCRTGTDTSLGSSCDISTIEGVVMKVVVVRKAFEESWVVFDRSQGNS